MGIQTETVTVNDFSMDYIRFGHGDRVLVILPGLSVESVMKYGDAPTLEDADWSWRWPKPPLVDEEAQARADAIRVKSYQATIREIWEDRHPDSRFEEVKAEIDADRKAYPEIYGAAPDTAEQVAPPAEGTRINEPKAPEIGKQRGEE